MKFIYIFVVYITQFVHSNELKIVPKADAPPPYELCDIPSVVGTYYLLQMEKGTNHTKESKNKAPFKIKEKYFSEENIKLFLIQIGSDGRFFLLCAMLVSIVVLLNFVAELYLIYLK